MSEYFDAKSAVLEQEHITREHARMSNSDDRAYDLAWLVLALVGVGAMIWVLQ